MGTKIKDSEYLYETRGFTLPDNFIKTYKNKQPKWGPLGYITYKRTYSRKKENGETEEFWETLRRVVEGTFTIQKQHCMKLGLPWNYDKAHRSAQKMYTKMWNFKFLPPGRGLWIMGTKYIEKHGSSALNNCFRYDTEIITRQGNKQIGACENTNQILLTTNGKWVEAPIRNFGKQKLWKLTLKRQGIEKEIHCTKDHNWYLEDNTKLTTDNLQPENKLEYNIIKLNKILPSFPDLEIPWIVQSVKETDIIEDVYCATVKNYEKFTLADNILTGNCGFLSTDDIAIKLTKPFEFMMDMSMMGVGIGFDTLGAEKIEIKQPKENKGHIFQISDTREGWVESLRLLLEAYFHGNAKYVFDYSKIRKEGLPLKGFGGISAGPGPLIELHKNIDKLLESRIGERLRSTDIVDLMNFIGKCVVAGNIRRCLFDDSYVLTDKGKIKINEVKIGDKVLNANKYEKVVDWFPSGKQEVWKIKTKNKTIYNTTDKHTLLVYDKSVKKFLWKMTKEINKKTDFLVKPKKTNKGN